MDQIRIPKERIPILIGKKGYIKRKISNLTNTIIKIDSKEGDAIIEGDDGLNVFLAKKIIHAISRGFNPDIALSLMDENKVFEIINITDYSKNSQKNIIRLRSRIIGEQGKARKNLEYLTNTEISVYGKTISIIGYYEDVHIARHAIESLLSGSKHGNVYNYIERQKKLKKDG